MVSLLETAKDLPTMSDPVRRQLEYSKALAERQLRKRKLNSAEVDACVKRFSDKRAERNAEIGRTMQRLRDLTKKSEEAKASALAAKEELQKIKAEEMEEKRKEQEQVQALESMRFFDAKMCCFGLEYGGNQSYQKARFDLLERVRKIFPPLPQHMEQNWIPFRQQFSILLDAWDHIKSRHVGHNGKAYGAYFKTEMEGLIKARQKGNMNAFREWYGQQMHLNKDMFVNYVGA